MSSRLLLVEDEALLRESLAAILTAAGYEVTAAAGGREALELLKAGAYELVISDIAMPGLDGMELLRRGRTGENPPEFILVTAYASLEAAVAAVKAGAFTYLAKPVNPDELQLMVERALAARRDRAELRFLKRTLAGADGFHGLIGKSPMMQRLYATIEKVADTPSTVLILGETGTGKELVARALHRIGHRSAKQFVAIDCGSLPANLLESELFGHERGAFTGAETRKLGLFEAAAGGTLFLDEIAEAPLEVQAKLLRALQDRTIRRLGGTADIPCEVRIVCATNQDLDQKVADGKFRPELLYRIRVVPLLLPPLRDRKEDLPLLIEHFLRKHAILLHKPLTGVSEDALKALLDHNWPGNVRELENVIESAAALTGDELLRVEDLQLAHRIPPAIAGAGRDTNLTYRQFQEERVDRIEREYFRDLLRIAGGNISAAARAAGIDRKNFYLKLKAHHLTRENGDGGSVTQ